MGQERDREMADNIKKFAKFFQFLQPLQYRDLISSVEEEFFGRVLEVKATKGDIGIVLLADLLMTFNLP